MTTPVQLDLTDPKFVTNPYPFYKELRQEGPIHWHQNKFWMIMHYSDSVEILQDPRFIRPPRTSDEELERLIEQKQLSPQGFMNAYGILWQNPPDHTRLRRLFTKAFTPKVVNSLRPKIESTVNDILERAAERGEMEVIGDLAHPLPVLMIMELLGVPIEDREVLKAWSLDLIATFDPFLRSPEVKERGNKAIANFIEYFRTLIHDRRRQPQDDLLSSMISVQDEGDQLSNREVLANATFLFVSGHETTTGLIGNGLLALLRHREQLSLLRNDPSLAETAVEEFLRYDSPSQTIFWTVSENVTWAGQEIQPGDLLLIMVGSANRDPHQFEDPERLDITRTHNRHLAFSHGPRYCLGAPLARAHGQIAIPMLISRFPSISMAAEPEWEDTIFIRGLKSLPVSLHG